MSLSFSDLHVKEKSHKQGPRANVPCQLMLWNLHQRSPRCLRAPSCAQKCAAPHLSRGAQWGGAGVCARVGTCAGVGACEMHAAPKPSPSGGKMSLLASFPDVNLLVDSH